jgi:hypothetical protein
MAGVGFYSEYRTVAPLIPVVGLGATLAIARSFWASSTRKSRDRIAQFIDAMRQTLVPK